jgi:hypothetical protein
VIGLLGLPAVKRRSDKEDRRFHPFIKFYEFNKRVSFPWIYQLIELIPDLWAQVG